MGKLLICAAVGAFIILLLVMICWDITPEWPEPGEFDVKDPWTGEIVG